jgi:uncharacterized protein (DUF4415 family)
MLDLTKATEILETYFANVTSEQFAVDIQKFCPELFEEETDNLDLPRLSEELSENANLRIPVTHVHQLIQIDPDVLQWFQAQGSDYKSLINSVLRHHIEQEHGNRCDAAINELKIHEPLIFAVVAAASNQNLAEELEPQLIKGSENGRGKLVIAIRRILAGERSIEALWDDLNMTDSMIIHAIIDRLNTTRS